MFYHYNKLGSSTAIKNPAILGRRWKMCHQYLRREKEGPTRLLSNLHFWKIDNASGAARFLVLCFTSPSFQTFPDWYENRQCINNFPGKLWSEQFRRTRIPRLFIMEFLQNCRVSYPLTMILSFGSSQNDIPKRTQKVVNTKTESEFDSIDPNSTFLRTSLLLLIFQRNQETRIKVASLFGMKQI